jgi:AbiTii
MLLDDIIALATDDSQRIGVLLRKCIVLGHRLKNDQLKAWANKELNGYGPDDELPDYRKTPAHSQGVFIGPGWSQMKSLIPPSSLDEPHQLFAREAHLVQGIAAYEQAIQSKASGVMIPWPPDLVVHYQDRIMDIMHLHSAYQEIPKSSLADLLDTVRTRVLNLALEIQGQIGEDDPDLRHVEPATQSLINQTVNQYIYGGQGFLSTASMTVHQQNLTHNWENLEAALRASGVSQPELKELSSAVNQDGKTMGANVIGWIKKTAPKVLSGGVKVGAGVGQALLTEFAKQYFGLT